jgi:hypothetical protein
MQLRTGRYDGVDLTDIPKEDLVKIVANSTNIGSPFTQKEIDAVKAEIEARTALEPKPEPEPETRPELKPRPKPETQAEARARARAEAKADKEEDDDEGEEDED